MAKYVFDNCCFCVDLRLGCFIVGYLDLIGSAIGAILSIKMISDVGGMTNSFDPNVRHLGNTLLALSIILLILLAYSMAFSIVLLFGLHKNKLGYIKTFIIASVVSLFLNVVLLVAKLCVLPFNAADIFSTILGLFLSTYILLVTRSYYYKMLENNENVHRSHQPKI